MSVMRLGPFEQNFDPSAPVGSTYNLVKIGLVAFEDMFEIFIL